MNKYILSVLVLVSESVIADVRSDDKTLIGSWCRHSYGMEIRTVLTETNFAISIINNKGELQNNPVENEITCNDIFTTCTDESNDNACTFKLITPDEYEYSCDEIVYHEKTRRCKS